MNESLQSNQTLYSRAGVVTEASQRQVPVRTEPRETVALPPGPYPGLRPFTQSESRLFCGRAMDRLRLLKMLAESHFLAVLGSSGSGKSSLILSGLIPDIRSGKLPGGGATSTSGLQFATFRPGRNPYANLAAALFKTWLGEELPDPFFIEESLRTSHLALARILTGEQREDVTDDLRRAASNRSLIIVVDQFEEIFRFADLVPKEMDEIDSTRRDFHSVAGDLDEAQAFISLLLATTRESGGRARVVITMRSDFFKHCEVFEGLPEAIAADQFITPRMGRDQMEDAIQIPLDHFGSSIPDDLINEILNDVHGEFDQLPVLQHALARMWCQAKLLRPPQPKELTADDYRRAKLLVGAMNDHGRELIHNNGLEETKVARFFRCLGDFDSSSGQAIRRPRTLAQIIAESGLSSDETHNIARIFAHPEASFIAVTPPLTETGKRPQGEIIVDLTHECLLRKWDGYKSWMNTERREGEAIQRVMGLMQEFKWNGRRSATGDHLTPGQLYRTLEALPGLDSRPQAWAGRYQGDVALAQGFLQAEKKHARWQRWKPRLLAGAGVLIVLAGVLEFARSQKAKFETEKAKVETEMIRAESEMARAESEMAKAKLAETAAKAAQDQTAAEERVRTLTEDQAKGQQRLFNQVGELEAKIGRSRDAVAQLLPLVPSSAGSLKRGLTKLLVSFDPKRDPASVDPPTKSSGASSLKLDGFKQISTLAWLPGSTPQQHELLLGGSAFWTLPIDLKTTQANGPPNFTNLLTSGSRTKVWTETAGSIEVSTAKDSAGWFLVTNAGPRIGIHRGPDSPWQVIDTIRETKQAGVTRARLIPDQRIAFGTGDGILGLLDAKVAVSNRATLFKSKHSKTINDVLADPSDKWLLASGDDNLATLWQIQAGLSLTLKDTLECGAPVRSASFSPNGRWALLPSGEKTIRLYLLPLADIRFDIEHVLMLQHNDPVVAGAFSPDGKWIATATTTGEICIWQSVPVPVSGDLSQPVGIFRNNARISALAWSPDSTLLATADVEGNAIIWQLQLGETVVGVPLITPKAEKTVDALAWSADGTLLAVGDASGSVQVNPLKRFLQGTRPPKSATQDTRMEAARLLLTMQGGNIAAPAADPVVAKWLQTLVDEGLPQDAEIVGFRFVAAKTDIVSRWLSGIDANSRKESDDTAFYAGLEVYLRYLVWNRGAVKTAQIIQTALGDFSDGIIGPSTSARLVDSSTKDPAALMNSLQEAAKEQSKKTRAPDILWAYYGRRNDDHDGWTTRHFKKEPRDDNAVPAPGESVVVKDPVTIRQDVLRFNLSGDWVLAKALGELKPGQKIKVLEVRGPNDEEVGRWGDIWITFHRPDAKLRPPLPDKSANSLRQFLKGK